LERKGSLGLKGGIGILDLLIALRVLRVLNLLGVKRGDEDDDEEGEGGMEVGMDMGNRKDVVAIVILFVAVDTTTLIWRG
jgi:hypothetical protein